MELTESMRQIDDSQFFDILNRIRIGSPNEDDIKILKSRLIETKNDLIEDTANFYNKLLEKSENTICLFPCRDKVNNFNEKMTKMLQINTYNVEAEDSWSKGSKQISKNNKSRITKTGKKKDQDVSDSAGLESNLKIGVNSRIMLRRNIDIEKGLCNGALGTVKKLYINTLGKVTCLDILFDGHSVCTKLEKVSAQFELWKNAFAIRKQFPICLAWAITIHKSQGLSLSSVMIDLGTSIHEKGMVYVALSRARKLENVFLIDFDPSKIECKTEAVEEYNRLYKEFMSSENEIKHYNSFKNSIFKSKEKSYNINIKKLIMNTVINTEKETVKTIEENISQAQKPISENYYLALTNDDLASCYANVIIQLLLSCGNYFFSKVRKLFYKLTEF